MAERMCGTNNDRLNGNRGNHRMDGGTGNDRYVVDSVGDVVIGPIGPDGAQVFSVSVDEQLPLAAEMLAPPAVAAAEDDPATQ